VDSSIHMARPRTANELAGLPDNPEVVSAARERDINDIVHFTSIHGAVGVLASGALKSRKRRPTEKNLEHVYRPNSKIRKDEEWLDYMNLSITRINDWMFEHSVRWHVHIGVSWVVLVFGPEVLGHPGVVFTTTNNMYPDCRRAEGATGLRILFEDSVTGRYGSVHDRKGKHPSWPTDRQAEVLYPGELSCQHLRGIKVQREEDVDTLAGACGALGREVPIRHTPGVFR